MALTTRGCKAKKIKGSFIEKVGFKQSLKEWVGFRCVKEGRRGSRNAEVRMFQTLDEPIVLGQMGFGLSSKLALMQGAGMDCLACMDEAGPCSALNVS